MDLGSPVLQGDLGVSARHSSPKRLQNHAFILTPRDRPLPLLLPFRKIPDQDGFMHGNRKLIAKQPLPSVASVSGDLKELMRRLTGTLPADRKPRTAYITDGL